MAGSSAMLNSVVAVHKAYESTHLYREIRLRTSLLNKGQLRLLPKERLHSRYNGIWNLSSDQVISPSASRNACLFVLQGNLGIFHITDIRIIWHAELNENFNVSVPYYQTKSLKIRDSKFGVALVVETTSYVSRVHGKCSSPTHPLRHRVAATFWDFNCFPRRNSARFTRRFSRCTEGKPAKK